MVEPYCKCPGCGQCASVSEITKLKTAIEQAAHYLKMFRMWDGMNWHWTHPYAKKAWDTLEKTSK